MSHRTMGDFDGPSSSSSGAIPDNDGAASALSTPFTSVADTELARWDTPDGVHPGWGPPYVPAPRSASREAAARSRIPWNMCAENKETILAMHSSETSTTVFDRECVYCCRWFKPCMFSIRMLKADNPACRWCQFDPTSKDDDMNQFQIHWHIHCNRPGRKICGENCTMDPAAPKNQMAAHPKKAPPPMKELTLKEVAPEPEVPMKLAVKKMSQKQRKAAARAQSEL